MKKALLALAAALLLEAPAAAASVDQFKQAFSVDEQRALGALLADPEKNAAFAADAQAADGAAQAELVLKWRIQVALMAQDYIGRTPATNTQARKLRDMVEPPEWGYLMTTLRLMEPGLIKDTFIGMVEAADAKLQQGDSSKALSVIKLARGKARGDLTQYLKTPPAQQALAQAERLRKAEPAQKLPPAKTPPAVQPIAKKDPPPTEPARKVIEQAEQIQKVLAGAKSGTLEGAQAEGGRAYDKGASSGQSSPVVVPGNTGSHAPALAPAAGKKPNLTAVPPPAAGADDMGELTKMKSGTGGLKKMLASAGVGLAAGAVAGFLLGGPLGALIGALVGAAAGCAAKKYLIKS